MNNHASGSLSPLDENWDGSRFNFALYADNADALELCLLEHESQQDKLPSKSTKKKRSIWSTLAEFALYISDIADLYQYGDHRPTASVSLVAAHDGSALQDLVGCKEKHNQANGAKSLVVYQHDESSALYFVIYNSHSGTVDFPLPIADKIGN